jgi:pyruvate/2-oxoglutarate/acetoin dehydrogenase E1 component
MPWTKVLQDSLDPSDIANGKGRQLTHAEAIHEALDQALEQDPRVYVMGQGVDDPGGIFGTTLNLHQKYGSSRVFDTPLSENALMGMAIGSALAGLRPVYFHTRPDFLLLAMDQIANHAAKWNYMFGGQTPVPLVIWAVTGRGWGSAAQHSQTLQGLFMHVPGLKMVMPATPADAKGLLLTAIVDNNPVLVLEHRWLFKQRGPVAGKKYLIPFGKGMIRRPGRDITIVAISQMVVEALKAAKELATMGFEAEVIDPRTLKPLDEELILKSVQKTGRLLIADTGWLTGGVGAEIAARVVEKGFAFLKSPIKRVACPDVPTPASYTLEEAFYQDYRKLVAEAKQLVAF